MSPSRIVFGTFDAESRWRTGPSPLPEVRLDATVGPAGAMDELLFPLCGTGDRLWTRYAGDAEHAGLLAELQLDVERRPLFEASRLCPEWRDPDAGRSVAELLLERHADELAQDVGRGACLHPYAVTDCEQRLARRLGTAARLPPLDAVRRVNSKLWTHRLRRELALGPASEVVDDAEQMRRLGRRLLRGGPLLAKDPYGVSGHGSVQIDAEPRLDRLAAHFARSVASGATPLLLLERFIPGARPFSAHLSIDEEGNTRIEGFRRSHEVGFGFLGSSPLPPELHRPATRTEASGLLSTLGERLYADGYFGPVCVDFLASADADGPMPLEMNARISLGRLALALERRLDRGPLTLLGLGVSSGRPRPYSALHAGLAAAGLLLGRRAGSVLPLAVNTLPAPAGGLGDGAQGKLYAALLHGARGLGDLPARLAAVLPQLGYHPALPALEVLAG